MNINELNTKNKISVNIYRMLVNDFMLNLHKQLSEKVAETTAGTYVKNLYALNNKKPFTNLAFLKKYDHIQTIMNGYASSTQQSLYGSILSVLSLYKDKPTYKRVYDKYTKLLSGHLEGTEKQPKNTKSKKQEENWITWDNINEIKNELKEKVKEIKTKNITAKQYDDILKYFVLSLYTDIPPRRNKDYQDCYFVKKFHKDLPTDRNYYDMTNNEFVFNSYKTSKTYGQQKVSVGGNEPFMEALKLYLKHHPLHKGRMGKSTMFPLLSFSTGAPFTSINAITRLLNKIFKKKVGSSMLRHIYLTSKYGDTLDQMKEDSAIMSHSQNQQKDYIVNKESED